MLLAFGGSGCQSTANDRDESKCKPTPGMTTAELTDCGCFSANHQTRYTSGLTVEDDDREVQSVTILSYLCPTASAGLTQVVVINGIAKNVHQ
ncbi:hypothetical protein CKO27_02705 [Thiocystis violacea]|nr:hypothetical protein [Thiocystis violacea]